MEIGGFRVGSAVGLVIAEGTISEPIRAVAPSIAIDAAWVLPAGSGHHFELGLRAERWAPEGLTPNHEVALFGAAHVVLSRRPLFFEITPSLGGGFRAGVARDPRFDGHFLVGSHLSLSFERPLFDGVTIAFGAQGFATIVAPLRATVSAGFSLFAADLL